MGLAFKKEANLNGQFRDEFASVQTFKFFTQNSLMDLKVNVKKYAADVAEVKRIQEEERNNLAGFKDANLEISNSIIDRKLKAVKILFSVELEKIKADVEKSQ